MALDLDFIQKQFPECSDYPEVVFCSNAGGSFVARPVLDLFDQYNSHTRVQPYSAFTPSHEAGEAMDAAFAGWAQALNSGLDELTLGPSTSMNVYVMAQAVGANWQPGDEIIVTQQDHEANIGAWRRKAEEKQVTIREWAIDPETGLLNPDDLDDLLNENTRWLFFTHCSNVVGTVNPVADIVRKVRLQSAARVCVDAVSYAPHQICDMKALGVDMYLFSLYKVFGPHQGVLYVNSDLSEELQGQGHYFNREDIRKRYNPAGPQHSQIAACKGVLDYFDAVHLHHGGDADASPVQKMQAVSRLISAQERSLAEPIVAWLDESPAVRLLGKPHCADGDRVATMAFKPLHKTAAAVTTAMQQDGIGTEHGDFYAPRALEAMGIETTDGVVRISLVHYNTEAHVQRILTALDRALT